MEMVHETHFQNHTLALTLADTDGRPVLDHTTYASLALSLQDAAANDEVKVVIMRGLSGCFCLGGDLAEFLVPDKHGILIESVTALFRTLATFPKPLIAAVDGDAVGVGCTMLFHCDLVYASAASTFRVPFVDFGLVPDAATSILAPEKLGYAAAFKFFCLGEELDAAAAERLGLVSDVVATDPETVARNTARLLARKPARSLMQTRSLLKGDTQVICDRIDQEITLFHEALHDDATVRRLRRIARMAA